MRKKFIIMALLMSAVITTTAFGASTKEDYAGEALGRIAEGKGNTAELYYIEEADIYVIYDSKAKDRWIPLPKTATEMSISYDGDDIPVEANVTVSMDGATEEDDEDDDDNDDDDTDDDDDNDVFLNH